MHHLKRQLNRRRASLWAMGSFGAVTLCLLIVNDQLLRAAARANPSSRVNWLFLSEPSQIDIAILGSSMAKEGVDPRLLSELTGQQVIQLAWGGRGVSEQALYWELFLERHSCQTLLLELHPRGLEQDVLPHPLDEFRYVARLKQPIVMRHLKRQFGLLKTATWRFVPMWAMAEFSSQIGWHDLLAIRRSESFDPNSAADNRHTAEFEDLRSQRHDPNWQPGVTEVDPLAVQQFDEIVALCQKNNIRVIAFVPPIFQTDAALQELVLARYRQLLGSALVYQPAGEYLSDGKYFQDAWHVNDRGSGEFTRGLAEFLK